MSIANFNKLLEGDYLLVQKGKVCSEEHVEVYEHFKKESTKFISEITTRLATGEMLKINSLYEINQRGLPERVMVKRSVGAQLVQEIYLANHRNNQLTYEFRCGEIYQSITKTMTGAYHISSPAFSTTLICTLNKQINSVGRTRYNFVVSQNDWEWSGEFKEESVYIASSAYDQVNITILDKTRQAKKCQMFRHDSIENVQERPVVFYISKHMALPYKIELAPDVEVRVKHLKKFESAQFNTDGMPVDVD